MPPIPSYTLMRNHEQILNELLTNFQAQVYREIPCNDTMPSSEALQSIDIRRLELVQRELECIRSELPGILARHNAEKEPVSDTQENEEICLHCKQHFSSDSRLFRSICDHLFHRECILIHFFTSGDTAKCPKCAVPIVQEDLMCPDVQNTETNMNWAFNNWVLQKLSENLSSSEEWLQSLTEAFVELHVAVEEGREDMSALRKLLGLAKGETLKELVLVCGMFSLQMASYRALRRGMASDTAREWGYIATNTDY